MRIVLAVLAAAVLVGVAVAVYALGAIGNRHREMVQQCKTLRTGMREQQVLDTLGKPTRTVRTKQGALVLERMFFAPSSVLPDFSAQPIIVDVDVADRQAVRVVCDEDSHLRSPEVEALERKGIY